MKSVLLLVSIVLLLVSAAFAEEDAVMVLGSKNFAKVINGNEFVLVEFYAPWCGHCKNLEPEYKKAAAELASSGIVLAKVDATVESELAEEHGVKGYPTLKYFAKGEEQEYTGGRTADEIIRWMRKRSGPAAVTLTSVEEVEEFKKKNDAPVVGFFAKKTSAYKSFQKVAESEDSFDFAEVLGDTSISQHFGVSDVPAVTYFRSAEFGPQVTYTGDVDGIFDSVALSKFLKRNSIPPVGFIGPESFGKYYDSGMPLFIGFIDVEDSDQKDMLHNAMKEMQSEHAGKHNYGYTDGIQFREQAKRFGTSGTVPNCAWLNFEKNQNIGYDSETYGPFNAAGFKQWARAVASGAVKWKPKSEPVPTSNDDDVFVAVGSNLEEIINQKKDVLMEYYAPWCGHCKALAPKYERVAELLAGVDSLVIAKIDADANEVAHVEKIQGFPTLVFYPANDKTPLVYNGAREVKDIVEWLKDHSSKPFELKDEL